MIAYRIDRSFAWNAAHPPKLPPRPRRLPAGPGARIFDRPIDGAMGVAAGPLPNSKWILAYARLGYGLLTYKTSDEVRGFLLKTAVLDRCVAPCVMRCVSGLEAVSCSST